MKPTGSDFIRITDLAEACGVHTNTIERYLFHDVITPDGTIRHGRSRQPIFLENRLAEHIKAIKRHRQSLEKAAV
jgi:hypothetical protein